jgi:RHS repeat-associated protein
MRRQLIFGSLFMLKEIPYVFRICFLFLLLMISGYSVKAQAQSSPDFQGSSCVGRGGTYPSCYPPLATYWTDDNYSYVFATQQDAGLFWYNNTLSNPGNYYDCYTNSTETCTYQILAPANNSQPDIAYTLQYYSTSNGTTTAVGSDGLKATAICNPGDFEILDSNSQQQNIWSCSPPYSSNTPPSYSSQATSASDLFPKQGCGKSCDPVDLATLLLTDYKVDYQNDSPFPIVWSRRYVSTANYGKWIFNYSRIALAIENNSTSASMMISREDGQQIELIGTRTSSTSDWIWTPTANPSGTTVATPMVATVTSAQDLSWVKIQNLSDQTEMYDNTGKLISITDLDGNALTFTYTANQLTQITDSTGRYLNITYNNQTVSANTGTVNNSGNTVYQNVYYYAGANNLMNNINPASVTDGVSTISYSYSTQYNSNYALYTTLNSVTHEDNTVTTYQYNASGFWTGTLDENNNTYQTYNYSSSTPSQVSSTSLGSGVDTYSFSSSSITYPNGTSTSIVINTNNQITYLSRPCYTCDVMNDNSVTYDAYGNAITIQDFNRNIQSNTFDTTRSLPLTVTNAYNTSLAQTTTYQWDTRFRKPDQIVEPVQTPTGAGTLTTVLNYDNSGDLLNWIKTVNGPSGYSSTRTGSATYNNAGQMLTQTDANGNVTTYGYDNLGDLTSVENALGQTTTLGGYDERGNVGWMIDPNGLKTTITYDARKRITQIQKGSSSTHQEVYSFSYYPTGLTKQITAPNGTGVMYYYDTAHRLNETDILSSSGSVLGKKILTLNNSGVPTNISYQNASGIAIQAQNFTYDDMSRVNDFIDQENDNFTQTHDYENNLLTSKDPLGNGSTYQYDALNRFSQATEADNSVTSASYGAGNEVATQTDPRGLVTSYSYDGFGNVVTRNSPDSGTTSYTYDSNDNMLTRTDARGATVNIVYDALNRELSETGSVSGEVKQFTYDTCSNGVGKLCSVTDRTGAINFTYDLWGRMTQKQEVMNGITFTLGYSYDNYGELSSITYPSGQIVSYTYLNGNVQSVSTSSVPILTNATYDPFDRLLGWTWNNGRQVSYTYDMDGRLSNISSGTTTMAYTRDNAWKIAGLNEVNPTLSMSYGYDSRNRLTTSNVWGTYAYDVNSNRTSYLGSLGPLSYTYGTMNNQLLTYNSTNISMDAMGDIISKNGLTLTYDDWGRMRTSNNGNGTYTYGVNGLDERVSKTNGTSAYYYIYAGVGQLLGIYNASGQAMDEMVYLNDKPIASVRSGVVYNVETDNLNTPVRVLDQSNNIDWSWEGKEPFGLSQPTQAVVNGNDFIFNLRFPGQYADQETGLFQNGYREYDPFTGRYMEVDPLGLNAGWNPYNYVESNSLNNIDPLGQKIVAGLGIDPNNLNMVLNTARQNPMASTILDRIENDPRVLEVRYVKESLNRSDKYDPATNIIYWDPNSGLETDDGGCQSPMTQLLHEFDHADLNLFREKFYSAISVYYYDHREKFHNKEWNDRWTHIDEMRVIVTFETQFAKFFNEGTRNDHHGTPFNACSSISNKEC